MSNIVITSAVRTAVGSIGKSLKNVPADDLGSNVISNALKKLRNSGCRVIWMNPLKGWRNYAPVTAGMKAALPLLDLFATANTLSDLAALEGELRRI